MWSTTTVLLSLRERTGHHAERDEHERCLRPDPCQQKPLPVGGGEYRSASIEARVVFDTPPAIYDSWREDQWPQYNGQDRQCGQVSDRRACHRRTAKSGFWLSRKAAVILSATVILSAAKDLVGDSAHKHRQPRFFATLRMTCFSDPSFSFSQILFGTKRLFTIHLRLDFSSRPIFCLEIRPPPMLS